MLTIEYECSYGNGIIFCGFIVISNYDQTYLQVFIWNNGETKIIDNIYKLVFCPGKLQNCKFDLWSWIFTIIGIKQWKEKNVLWHL